MNFPSIQLVFFLVGLMWLAISAPVQAQDSEQTINVQNSAAKPSASLSNRNVLLGFAQCLKNNSLAVVANPQSPRHICGVTLFEAGNTTAPDSVVIEDLKMSKCPANIGADEGNPRSFTYVHALAIPLNQVTGVEQEDHRPNGIWDLAWRTATAYIADTAEIALVANPKAENQYRSQDQLHIHLVRLRPGVKEEILHPKGSHRVPPTYIERLDGDSDPVWAAAELNAGELATHLDLPPGLKSGAFGVAVVLDESQGKYAVVAVDDSPEKDFTMQCPGSTWHP